MNLPSAFNEKMKELLQEDYSAYMDCFEKPRYYGLRVNTGKISVKEFLKISPFVLKPIPWIHNGFYYDGEKEKPSRHPYYFAGLYYLQEPSAMTPADRLPVEPGNRVLDLCAAPGGKTTELGARLQGKGILAANDISHSRAKGLLKNIELFGIPNVFVLSEEPGKLIPFFAEYFDRILIDAPCSGEGMFRKDARMVRAWQEHGPAFFSSIQKDIVVKAAKMLRPGGMMLYSTCTFDPTENEQTVAWLLASCPDMEIVEMEGYEGFSPGMPFYVDEQIRRDQDFTKTVRIFPHRMDGEGHYLALLHKKGCADPVPDTIRSFSGSKEIPVELEAFLAHLSWEIESGRLEYHGEQVYYMPENTPVMKGIRFLRTGLYMGELKKNRFEPSQALAMCLRAQDYDQTISLSATDGRVIRYLKGETLQVEDVTGREQKGWFLVLVDGFPLGFGKLAKGMLKNKYLPGWRWMS